MRFKEWLQQEISLGLPNPAPVSNPTMVNKATDNAAKATLAKFEPKVTTSMLKAPNDKFAYQTAVKFATKSMNSAPNPAQSNTDPAAVGAKVYSQATGKEPHNDI